MALLFAGYAAYYFCRSDLSVAMPLLIDDLQRHGVSNHDAVVRSDGVAFAKRPELRRLQTGNWPRHASSNGTATGNPELLQEWVELFFS